jgi:hypothetical protein
LPAFDADDCLLGVCEKAGVENDSEIAAVKNAIEMINAKRFIGILHPLDLLHFSRRNARSQGGACGWFLLEGP